MKLVWHLVKFNFIFNKIRITFLCFVSLLILSLSLYLNTDLKLAGQDMMQYSFYAIFIIVVGKLNAKSTIMLDIKHMLSLPLSKKEIVWMKSLADIVHYFPLSIVLAVGGELAFPQYHLPVLFIIVHFILFIANMVALNKRIDFARMQHSQTSFKNSILYLNKYLDSMAFIFFTSVLGMVIVGGLKDHLIVQEYMLIIALILLSFFIFARTVKILGDETLSYFILRRDLVRMGAKAVIFGLPTLIVLMSQNSIQKKLKQIKSGNNYAQNIGEQFDKLSLKVDEKRLLVAITQKDHEEIKTYLMTHDDLPWKAHILGGYIPHLAAGTGNVEMLKEVIKRKPEHVNMVGKFKRRTPLFTALSNCQLASAQFLIDHKANLNQRDINGDTPAIYAARNGCLGGVILLNQYGADFKLENKKKENVFAYIKGSGIEHFFYDQNISRSIASEKKTKASSSK